MNLTAEQVKNLNILADFMDGLQLRDGDNFTMSIFWHQNECGTRGCALGWATTVPALRAKGLTGEFCGFDDLHCDTWARAEEFFGGGTYKNLFAGYSHGHLETPQQWATHCRALLKSNGYATTDHFKTFMDRVMIPVDTEQMEERERE